MESSVVGGMGGEVEGSGRVIVSQLWRFTRGFPKGVSVSEMGSEDGMSGSERSSRSLMVVLPARNSMQANLSARTFY